MTVAGGIFVAGTDTGVGKTYVSASLLRGLRRAGIAAAGFKPICCGDRDDAELLAAASATGLPLNDVNPLWLRAPASPLAASMIENRPLDLDLLREKFGELRARFPFLVVEGVGGWEVPVTATLRMSELAVEFALPVLLVVENRLGCLNHTLLTLAAIQHAGLVCRGIVLNQRREPADEESIATATNHSILESMCAVPILFLGQGAMADDTLAGFVSGF